MSRALDLLKRAWTVLLPSLGTLTPAIASVVTGILLGVFTPLRDIVVDAIWHENAKLEMLTPRAAGIGQPIHLSFLLLQGNRVALSDGFVEIQTKNLSPTMPVMVKYHDLPFGGVVTSPETYYAMGSSPAIVSTRLRTNKRQDYPKMETRISIVLDRANPTPTQADLSGRYFFDVSGNQGEITIKQESTPGRDKRGNVFGSYDFYTSSEVGTVTGVRDGEHLNLSLGDIGKPSYWHLEANPTYVKNTTIVSSIGGTLDRMVLPASGTLAKSQEHYQFFASPAKLNSN